ncbi:hypothetical protein [Paraburkholderia caribensis]|uniref:hypothetical protein n=1 Tax=Paraburkholderia caribensis TaxID=75105 RepID=UPI0011DF0759|nr:hypothetical protein [Paraburkholderia caribensis]
MDKQIALIARWHRRVVDAGARLLAVSCFDNTKFVHGHNALEDDIMSFEPWSLEFTIEVVDSLHDFCFFCRKVIERANMRALAQTTFPHANMISHKIKQGGLDEVEVSLCQRDLWWILGRVIHSTSTFVLGGAREDLIVYPDGKTRSYADSRVFVQIESDFDKQTGNSHVIHIPSLVHCYVSSMLAHNVREVVRSNTLS